MHKILNFKISESGTLWICSTFLVQVLSSQILSADPIGGVKSPSFQEVWRGRTIICPFIAKSIVVITKGCKKEQFRKCLVFCTADS